MGSLYSSRERKLPALSHVISFCGAGTQHLPCPPFSQINASQLRQGAPGRVAEASALRTALGPGYEARLRQEAGACAGVLRHRAQCAVA